jgi:hypothetical protein
MRADGESMRCLSLMLLVLCSACAHHYSPIHGEENGWVVQHEAGSGEQVPYYCMGNRDQPEKNKAKPVCYRAQILKWPSSSEK